MQPSIGMLATDTEGDWRWTGFADMQFERSPQRCRWKIIAQTDSYIYLQGLHSEKHVGEAAIARYRVAWATPGDVLHILTVQSHVDLVVEHGR